jgi:hypothetical protein
MYSVTEEFRTIKEDPDLFRKMFSTLSSEDSLNLREPKLIIWLALDLVHEPWLFIGI